MNGVADDLKPEVMSFLKQQRMLGNLALFSMIATGFAGLYFTYTCNSLDAFAWAVGTFCVAFAEAILGSYRLSRSAIPVNNPNVFLIGFIGLAGAALSGWLLYYSWDEYFTSRDEDAGLAVAMIALYLFFKPMQYLFVLYNYKHGVYHRILAMNEETGRGV